MPPGTENIHAVVLDVGHGNAAVFIDGDEALVVDAGAGDLVTDTLERYGVSDVAALVISHRHHDHTSELPALLSNPDIRIKKLFLNADPSRQPSSAFETQLRGALNDSIRRNGTQYQQANVTLGEEMGTENLSVEVLSPTAELCLAGVGSPTDAGGVLHAHALAVVLRVGVDGGRSMVMGADLDHHGLRGLIEDTDVDLKADVLVYPHHGGLAGVGTERGEEELAKELTAAVDPEAVIVSNGRERYANPRREIVRGVRKARTVPPIRLVCTQLSKECLAEVVRDDRRLDETLSSLGAETGASCSGSIRVDLVGEGPLLPKGAQHLEFVIDTVGGSALCVNAELVVNESSVD